MLSKERIIGLGVLVMLVGSACGVSSLGSASQTAGGETPTAAATEAPMLPVPINEGLASLDSYRMTYTNDVFGSLAQQGNVITLVMARDQAADATYNRTETHVTNAAGEAVSDDGQEQYVIGNQICVLQGGEGELTTMSETARVMSDLLSQVITFNPLIENPVYVGEDVVNGVPVRTYTVEVRSLGAASGAEATRADGGYAIAVDRDYVVHYRLDLELRTGPGGNPQAESSVSSFEVSLEDINQPVDLAFPAGCQAADSSGGKVVPFRLQRVHAPGSWPNDAGCRIAA